MPNQLEELRAAFDGSDVAAKNLALRKAHDALKEIQRQRDQELKRGNQLAEKLRTAINGLSFISESDTGRFGAKARRTLSDLE